jgi:nucleoside phosphorylase
VTREIIGHFSPRHILLAGIAGGLEERGVAIGDAIVPSAIFHYEPEKLLKGESGYRPMPYDCDPFIQRVVQHLAVTGELEAVMDTGKVHYKHYASGDKVLASSEAPLRQRILDISEDVAGFEMEAPGVLHAVREAYKERHFAGSVLKCVSDFGDDRMDESKKDGNRKIALERAARLLPLVLPELSPSR